MKLLKQWPHVQLNSICTKIGSGSTPRGGDSVYVGTGTAIIRSQNVYNGKFSVDGLAHILEKHAEQLNGVIVESRDVLLNITGDSVARCCQVPEWVLPARVNQHVAIVRPDSNQLLPEFLCYYFVSPLMQKYLLSRAGSGGTRNALTKGMIESFEVPCPDLITQQRIVDLLRNYDDLIENNRRRIQLLEQAARLLYKEWFVRLRFPGYEHVKIKDGVPEGWVKKPLGELLTLQRGFDLPSSQRKDGLYPIYASTGINGYHVEAKVKGPGVVTGRSGSLGTVMFVSSDFWPLNTALWVKEFKLIGPHFATHLLMNMQLEQYNGGAAVPTLNRNDVHRVEVLCPPATLLQLFEDYDKDIVQQIDLLKKMVAKLEGGRDLLLPRLMNGEVAV